MIAGVEAKASPLDAFLKRLRLHSPLSPQDEQALLSLPWKPLERNPNSHLVRAGDATGRCHILIEGFVHRYRLTDDGQRQILAFYVPGDPLDFDHLFLPIADDGLQALRQCSLVQVAQDDLRELLARRPALAEAVTRAALVDASIAREWILNVGRRDARARIAHLLCEVSTRLQVIGFDFESTPLPLTQEQIADATGLTPVHVNRVLKSLSAEGLIDRVRGLVVVPNVVVLQRIAGFYPNYLHSQI